MKAHDRDALVSAVVARAVNDGKPRWLHLPIAQAQLLSPDVEIPRYCETPRHKGQRFIATTFHATINLADEEDRAWVACADCTGLMMETVS